jgi:hypothetical protein
LPTIHAPNLQKVVAIVSTGRTGTKALATHLTAAYPNVLALHEPPPTRFTLRRASNKALCGRISRDRLTKILTRHRRALASIPQTVYVESNPGLSGFLDVLGDVFPNLQILHVVRDPRTYVASALNWGVFSGLKGLMVSVVPYWLPKPQHLRDAPFSRDPKGSASSETLTHSQMSPIQRLAWHWKLVNEFLDRGQALYGDRYHRIKFEDLFARDGSGFAWFADWAALPPKPDLAAAANAENVNASKAGQARKFQDWPDDQKRSLLHYCAPLMQSYGYDLSAEKSLIT